VAELGRYLYAISRGFDASRLGSTTGLSGARIDVVEHRGLLAIVSDVDLTEFGEEGLRRNLERLDWLEEVARGHDAVVRAVADLGPTAPVRLATICLDDAAVRRRLDEWSQALELVLDRVRGRVEWSVKAYAASAMATGTPSAASGPQPHSGAAYLQRKKAELLSREASEEDAARLAQHLHEELAAASAASRQLPAQDPRLTGNTAAMTLNGAYLVDRSDSEKFESVVRRLQIANPEAGIDLSGPWPPYSFAILEQ
jgi:hypothetical protein